jgi:Ca2+-binding RTX toxin-like protein
MFSKALLVPLVGALVAAPGAAAAVTARAPAAQSVEVADRALVFRASPGVENDIILSSNVIDGTSSLTDTSGVSLTSTTCEVDGSNATCPTDGVRLFEIHLGDKDDNVYGDAPWWTPNGTFSVDGGAGDDSIEGNLFYYGDTLMGNKGDDRIRGRIGYDDIGGGPGNDLLSGGLDPDRMWGGPGRDVVRGGRGGDGLAGGKGEDVLRGGPGNDTIDSRDGVKDFVYGGAGKDSVRKDRFDVVRGVERTVDRFE